MEVNKKNSKLGDLQVYDSDAEVDQNSDTEPAQLEEYDVNQDEQELLPEDKEGLNQKINNIDRPPEGSYDEVTDEEAKAAGKFFGFIRGMYDNATDKWNDKKLAKQEAYEEFLQQKPKLMQNYKDQLVQKNKDNFITELERDLNKDPNNNKWNDAYKQLSSGISSVAGLIPNRQPSSALFGINGFNRPENVIGISGSIFGSFPGSNNPNNAMSKINQFTGTGRQQPQPQPISQNYGNNENVQMRNLQPQTPNALQDSNAIGSQVPKYSAAPNNDPNSVYARVIKIDKYGKKRSYLRKMRVPEVNQPQRANINQMQQNNVQYQQPQRNMFYNPEQVRYNIENSQQPSVNTFNPNAYLGMKSNFDTNKIIDIDANGKMKKFNFNSKAIDFN